MSRHRSSGSALLRIRGLLRKEWLEILRDPSSIAIAFVLPAILLFLFGYGVSLDPRNVRIALVKPLSSEAADALAEAFRGSPYFRVEPAADITTARLLLARREVQGIISLRDDFADRLEDGDAVVQLVVDGVDANTARIVEGYVRGVFARWLAGLRREEGPPAGLVIEHRMWFNTEINSRHFLIPGLIAIIMTLIGAMLTSLVVAREWERGTMEALFATPVRIREIMIGKLVPYFVLGMGSMAVATVMAVFLFGVPFRGSFLALTIMSAIYMVASLAYGLAVSAVARNQFVAGQVAIITAFLPAFILSGFLFDIRSMPWVIQLLTHIIPARYFVSSLQTLFLAGDVLPILLVDAAALLVIAAVFLAVARRKTRKSLE